MMIMPGRPTVDSRSRRAMRTVWAYLRDPAVLAMVAGTFFVSAVGQTLVQAYVDDRSVVTTAVLSALGSLFLAAAIVIGARRHDQATKNRRGPGQGTP